MALEHSALDWGMGKKNNTNSGGELIPVEYKIVSRYFQSKSSGNDHVRAGGKNKKNQKWIYGVEAVSYTHLTLPTTAIV